MAGDVFTGYRDKPELEEIDVHGIPTPGVYLMGSEISENATLEVAIGSLGDDLTPFCFQQSQIVLFARTEIAKREIIKSEKARKVSSMRFTKEQLVMLLCGHGYATILPFTKRGEPVKKDKSNLLLAGIFLLGGNMSIYLLNSFGGHIYYAYQQNRLVYIQPS